MNPQNIQPSDTLTHDTKSTPEEEEKNKVNISPQDVKKLRVKTGAGMLDCKKALLGANGDFGEAEKILKEQGLASADKRVGRKTNNGAVFSFITDKHGFHD